MGRDWNVEPQGDDKIIHISLCKTPLVAMLRPDVAAIAFAVARIPSLTWMIMLCCAMIWGQSHVNGCGKLKAVAEEEGPNDFNVSSMFAIVSEELRLPATLSMTLAAF